MNVTFACPECDNAARLKLPGAREWQCAHCDHLLPLAAPLSDDSITISPCTNRLHKPEALAKALRWRFRLVPQDAARSFSCVVCGNRELYKKKDFPHWLGLTILTVACLGSIIPYWLYHQWWTWAILIGSALFDGLLYLCVGDVIVCYRCQAHYRGCRPGTDHKPYELGIAERYRQERLRREQLQAARKPQ